MSRLESRRKYKKTHPWASSFNCIMGRCYCNKNSSYYGRIKNFLSLEDIKKLWFRDKAWKLKRPSIDRIDDTKHYTLENCRFIELRENLIRGKMKYATPVIQLTLEGKEIARFPSQAEASQQTGVSRSSIGYVARGQMNASGGYLWKFS